MEGKGGLRLEESRVWEAVEATTRRSAPLHHLIVPGIIMQPSGGCLPVQQYFNSRRPHGLLCVASQRMRIGGSDGWLWGWERTLRKERLVMRVLVMLCFRRAAGPLHGASI